MQADLEANLVSLGLTAEDAARFVLRPDGQQVGVASVRCGEGGVEAWGRCRWPRRAESKHLIHADGPVQPALLVPILGQPCVACAPAATRRHGSLLGGSGPRVGVATGLGGRGRGAWLGVCAWLGVWVRVGGRRRVRGRGRRAASSCAPARRREEYH